MMSFRGQEEESREGRGIEHWVLSDSHDQEGLLCSYTERLDFSSEISEKIT